jgi:glycosyltransferase involved in cell wall biosynthesis
MDCATVEQQNLAGSAKRQRVLLSAFACSPVWGSEPGVGWQWMLRIARDHEVVMLTHAYFRGQIEPALASLGLQVEVHYIQAPAFGLHPHRQLNSRAYYTWWQWRLRAVAKRLLAERAFDFIHHLTWGTIRFPCLLTGLGVPLVMGPLGGGESAPMRLFAGLPFKVQAFDALRSLSLIWVRVDPLATWGPRRADLVLCRSSDSLRALPRGVQARAVVVPEIGSPDLDLSQRQPEARQDAAGPRRIRLLFAGRLLGWKGVAMAVTATSLLVQEGWNVQLDIAGEGPLRNHLAEQVQRLGLQDRVKLLGVIARPDLMALYAQADLFVFPSLHDSGGSVVLEALSRGLPVICLDLGGPKNYVDDESGVVVETGSRTRDALERALAAAIADVLRAPGRLAAMSRGAAAHAKRQSWEATVRRSYEVIGTRLGAARA